MEEERVFWPRYPSAAPNTASSFGVAKCLDSWSVGFIDKAINLNYLIKCVSIFVLPKVLKLLLPHPTTPATRDVCLIVKDFEKGIRPDHEPTVAHYEALLAEKGVKGVTKVMSLRELKVEYKTFESKTALSHLYDHFLVDARIIRLVPKFLGKPFYKRKKFPVQVKLDSKDLVKEVEKALSTSCLALTHTGTSSCLTVGLTSMPEDHLCANLVSAVRLLETRYPGGWSNIRALHLLSGTDSLPFYVTLRATKEVNIHQ